MSTMRDVAERAGVSVTTVSHVINGTRPVSEELRQRVMRAVEELRYQPNSLARSLRQGRSNTLGIIVPDINNPFFSEVARGIEDAGFNEAYSVILCNSDFDLEKEQLYTDVLLEKQVDGIIFVAAGMSAEQIRRLQEQQVPLVVIDRQVPGVDVECVLVDNELGGRLATDHLLQLGHRRIAMIMGPAGLSTSQGRLAGYRRALEEAGLAVDPSLLLEGDFRYEGGYEAARHLLGLSDPPSAIFVANDLMAVGAVSAALETGRRVPTDLSLVGYDDVRIALYNNPSLTTVAQPKYRMGELATRMLLERVRDPYMALRQRVLEPHLVVRHSTAAPSRSETAAEREAKPTAKRSSGEGSEEERKW